jgi:hypothetical protein
MNCKCTRCGCEVAEVTPKKHFQGVVHCPECGQDFAFTAIAPESIAASDSAESSNTTV